MFVYKMFLLRNKMRKKNETNKKRNTPGKGSDDSIDFVNILSVFF